MNKKGFIICVDDESSIVETLKEQLQDRFGDTHEILTASGGADALDLVKEIDNDGGVIEVLITDQVMPEMTGDELLKKINDLLPDTIKILLTGHAGLDSAIKAINYGGLHRYFEKPWDIDALSSEIETLISKFRENLENRHLIKKLESRILELETEN